MAYKPQVAKTTSANAKLSPDDPEPKSQRTKALIEQTFIKLLSEKPLKEIGVRELSREAGINRNTFYYHFKNIPDLIESLVKDSVDKVLAEHPPTYNSYEDCLLAAVEFAQSSKQSIYHIYNSTNRTIFERYLWKICDYTVRSYVDSFPPTVAQPTNEQHELFISILKYECFGFVMDWIMKGMPNDVSSRIRLLNSFIKNQADYTDIFKPAQA